MTLKNKSQSELQEASRALGEMKHVDLKTIRDIIRRTQTSVMRGVSIIIERTRPDFVVLFVSPRELPTALAIPTTRIAVQNDLQSIFGMSKLEAESLKLNVDTEGHVKFGEVFLCLRSRDVHEKVVKEKAKMAMEPSRVDVAAAQIRAKMPRSEAEESWRLSVGARPPADEES